MSNVSIYDKNWTDLVFEDKNKEYGAYQLRQENERTTLLAFFIGILFIASIIGFWLLLSSFGKNPVDDPMLDPDIHITPVTIEPVKPAEPNKPKAFPQKQQPVSHVETVNLSHIEVVATQNATQDVPQNINIDNTPTDTPTGGTGGETGVSTTPAITDGGGTKPEDDTVKIPTQLDRMPEYPGGMGNFYKDVADAIDKSNIEDITSYNVIVGFVIERDGSLSDIKILRGSDKILEKEAIRALKSMRKKWNPGWLNGAKVRTQYSLPIKVANQ